MVTPALIMYIQTQLHTGTSRMVIINALTAQGWKEADITGAFQHIDNAQSATIPTPPSLNGQTKRFSIEEALSHGWKGMRSHIGFFLLFSLVVFVWYLLIFAGDFIIVLIAGLLHVPEFVPNLTVGIFNALTYIPLYLGALNIYLKIADNKPVHLGDLFSKFSLIIPFVFTSILSYILVMGGVVLLFVPGIIWTVEFIFAPFYVIDQGVGPIEALKRSVYATKHNRLRIELFILASAGVAILGLLAFGIGLFFAIPTIFIAQAFIYRRLQTQTAELPTDAKLLTWGKKIGLIVGIVFVTVLFSADLFPALYMKPFVISVMPRAANPLVYTLPQAHTIVQPTEDLTQFPHFDYFGMSFQTPWQNLKEKVTINTIASLTFDQNKHITFAYNSVRLVDTIAEKPTDRLNLKEALGEQTLQSDFNLYTAMMNTSPDNVVLYTPQKEATSNLGLSAMKYATVKAYAVTDATLYSFATHDIKGFQFGDPVNKRTFLHFFDTNDKAYDLIVKGDNITQKDIDFILFTLKTSALSAPQPTAPLMIADVQPTPAEKPVLIEPNLTVQIARITSDANSLSVVFTFNNSSAATKIIAPHFTMLSKTLGVPGETQVGSPLGSIHIPVGQATQLMVKFSKLSDPPFKFIYTTSTNTEVTVGAYSP